MEFLSFIPKQKINTFASAHYQFNDTKLKINNTTMEKNNMYSQYKSFKPFYTDIAPIYLFTFYLQNAIPDKILIDEITIDHKDNAILSTNNQIITEE